MQAEVSVQDNFLEAINIEDTSLIATFQNILQANPWERWFEAWLKLMSSDLPTARAYELSLRFITDSEMQALNSQYRQQNRPTDVLAFAALEVDFPEIPEFIPLYLGDIAISVETADRQARANNIDLLTELGWLAAHGFLHLLGWDHPDDESLRQMLHQQDILLSKVGFNVTLAPPSQ